MAHLLQGAAVWIRKCRENPLTSWTSRVAFAAFVCGFDLVSKKGFHHSIAADAETPEALEASRSVTWQWDAKRCATFKPIPAEETIGLAEFERRFNSLEWCHANPDHPIAYMRVFLEKSRDGMDKLRSIQPTLRHVRDGAVATAPADATEAEIDELFSRLEEA